MKETPIDKRASAIHPRPALEILNLTALTQQKMAALAALQGRDRSTALTLSGAFDALRAGAPLIAAGFIEIPLERPVRRLKVWRDDATSGPLSESSPGPCPQP